MVLQYSTASDQYASSETLISLQSSIDMVISCVHPASEPSESVLPEASARKASFGESVGYSMPACVRLAGTRVG